MTVVGEDTLLVGTLHSKDDLLVTGKFEGTLVTDGSVSIFSGAEVKGTVRANHLNVAGSIQGEIEVGNRLTVRKSAQLKGRVTTRFVDWEDGASFEGELSCCY